jgi:hypothetical protein
MNLLKWDVRLWTGLAWLRIEIDGGICIIQFQDVVGLCECNEQLMFC